MELDATYMRRCLELARRAEGRTAPNPMVGAVVLDAAGRVAGEGWHTRAGEPHAEVMALDAAGVRARGGTLYVNLEPCCHWGRTPPCAERLLASGISRVVTGMVDPNPAVAGGGIRALSEAGVAVAVAVLEEECRWLNRAFVKHKTEGMPWVSLKLASTLDGRIADRNGISRWVTGDSARAYVHGLRNRHDCVMVGGRTAKRDDPVLNVRDVEGGRDPLRAVVDSRLSLPASSRLCRRDSGGATVIFCLEEAMAKRGREFPDHVRLVPVDRDGHDPSLLDLSRVLAWLAVEDVMSVLCEGGGRLAGALVERHLADELYWFVSPRLLVDGAAVPALAGARGFELASAVPVRDATVEPVGDDFLFHGLLRPFGTGAPGAAPPAR